MVQQVSFEEVNQTVDEVASLHGDANQEKNCDHGESESRANDVE